MTDETFMTLMRLLPKAALSSAVGVATRAKLPPSWHQVAIRAFAKRYRVDLDEAALGVNEFPTFAQFFTRKLRDGIRPIDPDERAIVSPVDGAVSQAGYVSAGQCLQAKGVNFPVEKLLGDAEMAKLFTGGAFATLYLSPRDYHRIHSPLAGEIEGYSYLPGQFWPVNPASVRLKAALFCLNERLTTYLRTKAGLVAVVKVGATNVARIRASYDDIVTHTNQPGKAHRYAKPIPVAKGGELGIFEMGSTVILLFETGRIRWDASLVAEAKVQMGRKIGELV